MFSKSDFISNRKPSAFPDNVSIRGKENQKNQEEGGQSFKGKDENENTAGEFLVPPLPPRPRHRTLEASLSRSATAGRAHRRRRSKTVSTDRLFPPLDSIVSLSRPAALAKQAASSRSPLLDPVEGAVDSRRTKTEAAKNTMEQPNQIDNISCTPAWDWRLGVRLDPAFAREKLCITVGKKEGNNREEVTIWPVGDIDDSDEDMMVRVKDLVSFISYLRGLAKDLLTGIW